MDTREGQIEAFQAALAAAIETFRTDVEVHGECWADDELDATEAVSPRGMDEAIFVQEINEMVAADAPQTYAAVGEIGDRVDAVTMAYCLDFPDRFEVISADSCSQTQPADHCFPRAGRWSRVLVTWLEFFRDKCVALNAFLNRRYRQKCHR